MRSTKLFLIYLSNLVSLQLANVRDGGVTMKNKGLPAVWWRCARDVYHMMRVFLLLYLILCLLGITIESITPWIMTRVFELAQESLEIGRAHV